MTVVCGFFRVGASRIEFSGDLNNYVSAHKYKVYAPDDTLLDLVTNSIVPVENRFQIGHWRANLGNNYQF